MSENWTWRDEFDRIIESSVHDFVKKNKPTNINDLLDLFNKVVPPSSRGSFGDLVDDPTAATPPPPPAQEETTVAKSTAKIALFTCPACQRDVFGTAKFTADETDTPTLNEQGYFTVNMRMTGMRVDAHVCGPKVTR